MRVYSLALVSLLLLCTSSVWAQGPHVFILHSYSQEYPWTKHQHEGFVTTLNARLPGNIQYSTEYLDTKRKNLDPQYAARFSDYLRMKYSGYRPDVVYVTDDNALDFAIAHLQRLFPDVGVVFSGINDYSVLKRIDRTHFTGVFEKKEFAPNLRIIKGSRFAKGKFAFVGDGSETYEAIKHEISAELVHFPEIEPVFIASSEIDTITGKLSLYPYRTVFLTTIGGIKDAEGQPFSIAETIRRIRANGNFILLSMEDAYLESGVLGGYVTSGIRQGHAAARLAVAHLQGRPISQLEPVTTSPNEYIFDQQELARHHLQLPEDVRRQAKIMHPSLTFYETNRTLILATLILLAVLLFATLAISVLLMSRKNHQLRNIARQLQERNSQLTQTKESLVQAQRIASMGSWALDLQTNELEWSDEIYKIFEIDKETFSASYEAFLGAIHPDDRDKVNEAYLASVEDKSEYEIEHRLLMPDGRIKYAFERGKTYYDSDGKPVRSVGTVQDVTERVIAEQRMQQWAAVFESSIEGVIITDENARIIDVNRAFTEITGYSKDEVLGQKPNVRRSARHDDHFYETMWQSISQTGAWSGEIWNRKKNGELSPEWLSISTLYDSSGNVSNYVGVFTDISVLKRSEEKLEHLANHDPLTNLPNRSLLHDRLQRAIRRASRSGAHIAVLFLDLDRFKLINDTLGHVVGDKLLKQSSERMQGVLRNADTIGRQGGDEFVAIIEECGPLSEVEKVSERLRERISEPFEIDGQTLFIGVSIGISIFPVDGVDAATLIRNADSAMYKAKNMGRNNYAFYDTELTEKARKRMELDVALRSAIDNGEFLLYYQPKIELLSGRIVGAEALIRWLRDGKQLVNPDDFIPVAEESGVILSIGEWVLQEAAQQMRKWQDAGYQSLQLAVNLSAIQIQRGNIAQIISGLLERYQLQPSLFEFEITESVLFDHPEQAGKVLAQLRELGLQLAMDDFGTGFSSLKNLKQYPIDTIKIDRSFVRDLLHDQNDEAITRAVIAMGHSLDLTVVAEGVEETAQAEYLKSLGCSLAQGYLYGPPVIATDFEKLLERQSD